jgi:hypothetical protein
MTFPTGYLCQVTGSIVRTQLHERLLENSF